METKEKTAVVKQSDIAASVLSRVNAFQESGELMLSKNYSAANALKSAYLILQNTVDRNKKCVLESCTKYSIANALLDMVTQGLSPVKKQCYFIAYGGQLTLMPSYMGKIMIGKRDANIKEVYAQAIFEKDDFVFEVIDGVKVIKKHKQTLESLDSKVVGAYAIIEFNDGRKVSEVMNINQIHRAWNMRQGNGLSKAHEQFSDEMAKRTVINRALKPYVNSSDDSFILRDKEDKQKDMVDKTIEEEANKELISIKKSEPEEAEVIESKEVLKINKKAVNEANKPKEVVDKKTGEVIPDEPNY